MKNRILSAALAACLLCGAMAVPASAADAGELETVQALGIIEGGETGDLALEREVSRAEFAKMLTAASVYRDTAEGEGGYSLFRDVKSGFWAGGYIKTAIDAGWMVGYSDGTFRPDAAITLEEACAAALRLLGYDSSALNGPFPAAQLNKAAALGLRRGLERTEGEKMTRGDCAALFFHLMTAETASGQVYAATLGYALNSAGELDYAALAARDLKGPFTTADGSLGLPFSPRAVYRNGEAAAPESYDVYYYNENLRTVYLYNDRVTGVYTAASPSAAAPSAVTVGGGSYAVESAQAAYKLSAAGEFSTGDVVTLLLGMDGKVADVVSASVLTAEEMDYAGIVSSGLKGPYIAAAGGTVELPFDPAEAAVYLNGEPSGTEKIQGYDVYYYNETLKTVYVCNKRVTGRYTAAVPNAAAPVSVTVAGNTYGLGTASAEYRLSTLGGCAVGDVVTLLLGLDGDVAGVLTGAEVEAEYCGVVQSAERETDPVSGNTVELRLTMTCTDGESYTFQLPASVSFSAGQLAAVTVSEGEISARRLSEKTLSGSVDRTGTRLGGLRFAEDVQILDTLDTGTCAVIDPARLAGCTLDASHVRYYALDASGDISRLILDDATADAWSYGFVTAASEGSGTGISSSYACVIDGRSTTLAFNGKSYAVGVGGLALQYTASGEVKTMRNLSSARLTGVGTLTAQTEDRSRGVAENVQVYLKQADGYYQTSLSNVTGGGYTLTGWYDSFGCPAGGQIRVIVAQEKD